MNTSAVVLDAPRALSFRDVPLTPGSAGDVVVRTLFTGISTGTEKLLWTGEMPPFPGMGYPLIPGYESLGEVVDAGSSDSLKAGDRVFVPGASCFGEIRGLFGAAAGYIASDPSRLIRLDSGTGAEGALLALAATARHAMVGHALPDLIVGHGTLGRLMAELAVLEGKEPTVWEVNPDRRLADGYKVVHPDQDDRQAYDCIYDATGDATLLDGLIRRLTKGGEIVMAGFYPAPIQFAFPPAFMKEARLRIAAEWSPQDMNFVVDLLDRGRLNLADLITHRAHATRAADAYEQAFSDPNCLKMILEWEGVQ